MKSQRSNRFWEKVFKLFLLYLIITPIVFFLFDSKLATTNFRNDAFMFILKMAGIAMAISLLINIWFLQEKKLKSW